GFAVGGAWLEGGGPSVGADLYGVEMGPALRVGAWGGGQVDLEPARFLRADVVPPLDEVRLPLLERALQRAVVGEVDVVRDLLAVVDAHGISRFGCVQTRFQSNFGF